MTNDLKLVIEAGELFVSKGIICLQNQKLLKAQLLFISIVFNAAFFIDCFAVDVTI